MTTDRKRPDDNAGDENKRPGDKTSEGSRPGAARPSDERTDAGTRPGGAGGTHPKNS